MNCLSFVYVVIRFQVCIFDILNTANLIHEHNNRML